MPNNQKQPTRSKELDYALAKVLGEYQHLGLGTIIHSLSNVLSASYMTLLDQEEMAPLTEGKTEIAASMVESKSGYIIQQRTTLLSPAASILAVAEMSDQVHAVHKGNSTLQ